MTVAALYVDPKGVYAGLPDVEVWDEERDARTYAGPWPVVAHPPCARWSLLGACRGYRDGADDGCFAAALAAVRRFGGVLEHPAHTLAWERFALPKPARFGWSSALNDPGWSCVIDQGVYGHPAHKPTWLYYCGGDPPSELRWRDGGRRAENVNDLRGKSARRSATPPALRDVLLAMARDAEASLAIIPSASRA